jgi:cyclase
VHVGNHTIKIIHMPGNTAPQTSIHLPEEGVVFTGDNVFEKCKTFVQEADPWEWLSALKRIEALDVKTIVPGHGEPCGKSYLKGQAEIIENWIGLVEGFVQRGMSEKEALEQRIDVTRLDPYPIGQRLFEMSDRLDKWNVSNVYKHVVARKTGKRVKRTEPRSSTTPDLRLSPGSDAGHENRPRHDRRGGDVDARCRASCCKPLGVD